MAKRKRAARPPKARKKPQSPIVVLVSLIMLFQASGFVLLSVKSAPVDLYCLGLAVVVPLTCYLTTIGLARLFSIDQLLMALTHFLCGVGIMILYTMVPERGLRQAQFYLAGIGVIVVIIFAIRWIRSWKWLCWLMMPVGIGLLLLPVLFGEWQDGAKNWISLPWVGSFQPSELVKVMLVVVMAYFFSARRSLVQMLPALCFVVGCLGVLLLQRDLGTALLYYFATLVLYFVASSNLWLTLLGLGGGALAAILGYQMFAHVKVRVAMWRNPWSDIENKGYQIVQGLMAIGSGGMLGLGLGLGQPRVIPAYHTDFIFAVICEQFGILFGLCVVTVYVVLIVRGISVALRSRLSFYALLAFGCTTLIGIQTFVIIAGVIKMIPLTGITMPFISHGGTSMISCMALMGILQGVSVRNKLDTKRDAEMAGLSGEAELQ